MSGSYDSDKSASPSSSSLVIPVIAGLAVGIALIAIFSIWHSLAPTANSQQQQQSTPAISTVVIPPAASQATGHKTFEPNIIQVVIGVNNTVRWTNNDNVPSSVVADNDTADADFAAATRFPSGQIPANATNFLQPGQSFEFTFKQPGEIHYHSEPHPWLRGKITIVSPLGSEESDLRSQQ